MLDTEWKKKFTTFVESTKKRILRITDWKLLAKRLLVYFSFFVVVSLICNYLFYNYFNSYHTDADSARYMLSAMAQAQAAIAAIVITLTLIAVQLTASAYSPRVIDVFKKNPDIWILLGVYVVSISYVLIILRMVEGVAGKAMSQDSIWFFGCVSVPFEFCLSFAYWLEVFTLVALVPYMLNVIDLLRPGQIIKRLSEDITKENVLKHIESVEGNKKDQTKPIEENPLQPIMDIIHGSVMKYDVATTKIGLKVVTDWVVKIIDLYCEEKISRFFCGAFERVGRLTASNSDEESTVEVIVNLYNFSELVTEKRLEFATSEAAQSLMYVGKAAAGQGFDDATSEAARSLGDIWVAAAKNELELATSEAARSLVGVGVAAAENELEFATSEAARSLVGVGVAAAENELEDAVSQTARYLGVIGIIAAENRLGDATSKAVESLRDIWVAAVDAGLEEATSEAARSLVGVGVAAAENELEFATSEATQFLAELTISGEEIVKDAIRNYESKLKKQDPESFQKFMNLYEDELEKPHPRNSN